MLTVLDPPPHLAARAGGGLAAPPARAGAVRAGGGTPRPSPQALTFIDGPGPARPSPSPHFYRRALGRPGPPQALTFIDRAQASLAWANPSLLLANPSLLLAGPDPSFLLAGLGQVRARRGGQAPAAPRAPGGGQARLTNPLLTLAPRRACARRPPGARGKSAGGCSDQHLQTKHHQNGFVQTCCKAA